MRSKYAEPTYRALALAAPVEPVDPVDPVDPVRCGCAARGACDARWGGRGVALRAGAALEASGWASEVLGPKMTRCGLRSKLRMARPRSASVRRASTAS